MRILTVLVLLLCQTLLVAQDFYLGADLSYVNEMEDCGVVYQEEGQEKDPYQIFADNNCSLVRLRLWHTPSWYDTLNAGRRYSDLADVKKSIARAKSNNMKVLLDFHLSDRWADPAHQIIPKAWEEVAGNLTILKDSVYQYMYRTLMHLYEQNLLPEMVQVGNETNRGILQTQADNDSGWKLDWSRNSQLFNVAIKGVRDAERASGQKIQIVIHAAGPDAAEWLFPAFINNGVTDFDIMGISYYWAWHQPSTSQQTGLSIKNLRTNYPQYQVLIAETGYIWTTDYKDNAGNIISSTHPDYSPASPENQRDWLIDLTKEVMKNDGLGVLYWEPAWQSSDCFTPWGQGSHQEHATFFDFKNNLLPEGGVRWMNYNYNLTTSTLDRSLGGIKVYPLYEWDSIRIEIENERIRFPFQFQMFNSQGQKVFERAVSNPLSQFHMPKMPGGIYIIRLEDGRHRIEQRKIYWFGSK